MSIPKHETIKSTHRNAIGNVLIVISATSGKSIIYLPINSTAASRVTEQHVNCQVDGFRFRDEHLPNKDDL
jgi:hypothetical protein